MPYADPVKQREYHRNYIREWRANNPGQAAKAAAYYQANRDRFREQQRWTSLLRKYGVTKQQYEKMLSDQGGVCGCCGYPPKNHALDVDHCHETGDVRGLLCKRCNPLVERMASYLARSQTLSL